MNELISVRLNISTTMD